MTAKKEAMKSKVTLRATIDDVGTRKLVVSAKDADKVIAKIMQTGFEEKLTHSTKTYRVHAPGTIKHIDIEPIL